jgi:ribosomal protein L7/L12
VSECVISKAGTHRYETKLAKMLNLSCVTQSSLIGANKIPAIKFLREVVADNMGLAEAKWAVENWEKWITFVRTKGRAPKMQGEIFSPAGPKLI